MTHISVETTEVSPIFNAALAGLRGDLAARPGLQSNEPLLVGAAFGPGCLRDGVDAVDTVDQAEWEWLYTRLRAEAPELMPALEDLQAREDGSDGCVPIALFCIRYRRPGRRLGVAIARAARDDTDIARPDGPLDALFDSHDAIAGSALLAPQYWGFERQPDVHRGSAVRFKLASALWVSNGPRPESVEADFGDGQGYRSLGWDEPVEIDFAGDLSPRITLRARFAGGPRSATFLFRIAEPREQAFGSASEVFPAGEDRSQKIPAAIPYNGQIYHGVCHCYFGEGNRSGRLRRPILVAEGFPGGNHHDVIYDVFNGNTPGGWNSHAQLADALRKRGYDVVVLTFDTVGAPIQGNAFVYIAALQWMYGDMGYQNTIAAAGGSMGGLIARYALTYAEFGPEAHRVNFHYVDKLITFDSPHTGANVPLGVQYTARFFGPDWAGASLRLLDYACARQMLIHQVRLREGTEELTKPEFTGFYAELEGLGNGGYPTRPAKYAVSNGARDGGRLSPPEDLTLKQWRTHGAGGDRNYEVILHMSANGLVGERRQYANCFFANFGHRIVAYVGPNNPPQPFYSRDGGAGGFAGHIQLTSDQLNKPFSFPGIDLRHGRNCFVPAYSALGVKFTGDAYVGFKANDLKPGDTPFTAWYAPHFNQWHCTVDEGIAAWILELFPKPGALENAEALEAVV